MNKDEVNKEINELEEMLIAYKKVKGYENNSHPIYAPIVFRLNQLKHGVADKLPEIKGLNIPCEINMKK